MTENKRIAADTLGMEAAEMRRLGYKLVDMVVERHLHRNHEPAIQTGQPHDLLAALGGELPEYPLDADESLELLAQVALAHQQHGDHPRYFARVPGPGSFAALLGEWLGVGFNTIAASWGGGSGPATLETVVTGWLAQLLRLPTHTEGVILSGGSIANLNAFMVARHETGTGVAYLTDQTHASLKRNLQHMGLPDSHIRILPSDADYRMDMHTLRAAITGDRQAGLMPMMVVASAGTTNTGAVDPLVEIAALCREQGLWFHVDGAYGAPAALTAQGQRYLTGMELADSLVLDPHKWLFQPYDAGVCLITRPGALERCFAMYPEYLRDAQGQAQQVVNFGNRSLELTRRSRAVKLWMSLRTYGVARFRKAIQYGIELAELAEKVLHEQPDVWEVVTPAQIGIICFALRHAEPGEHARRAQTLADSGFACLTSTQLRGREVLRLCTLNPLTTETDIRETLARLAAYPLPARIV